MQNVLMRGSRGSRVLRRSHEMNNVSTVHLPCALGIYLVSNSTNFEVHYHHTRVFISKYNGGFN